ncbi:MAG: threonylcarbamoyl-AMP synthase [Bacteroidota bacterium]|nr:threonylcarbamoyl-AMP synthase [Bacteroidota bacterium]
MTTTIGTDLQLAKQLLDQDELVAIPTETVYGLAGNALRDAAVVKIFEAKNRPRFNPLIIHVPDVASIHQYAVMDALSEKLANHFMPGPFTLLLPKKEIVPDLVTAGSDKVAIRIPNHPLTKALLQSLNFPLAAPSANPFGYVSPTSARHVYEGLKGRIPYILDGGDCTVGVESTIAEVKEGAIIMHRHGGVSAEEIEQCTEIKITSGIKHSKPLTPGQLKSHYATTTPLYRGEVMQLLRQNPTKKTAIIAFQKTYPGIDPKDQYILSPSGNLEEAAQHLFAVMRKIDKEQYDLILTEIFPNEGLGRAINDRLERAQFVHK